MQVWNGHWDTTLFLVICSVCGSGSHPEPHTSHAPEHGSMSGSFPDQGWKQLTLPFSFLFGPGLQLMEQCHPHSRWIFPPPLTQSRNSHRHAQSLVYQVTVELVYIEINHLRDQSFETFRGLWESGKSSHNTQGPTLVDACSLVNVDSDR